MDSLPKTVSESVCNPKTKFSFPKDESGYGAVWLEIASEDSAKKLLEIASKYSKDFGQSKKVRSKRCFSFAKVRL